MQDQKTLKFIEKAKKVHGDKYDYSKSIYKNTTTKIKIICPEHGVFEQLPNNHLKGQGCGRCVGKRALTTDEVIEDFKKAHGEKYDYSKVIYLGAGKNITIICPEHGEFEQTPTTHKKGGCPRCAGNYKRSTEDIVKEFIKIHGDKYDYSLVNYTGAKNKVKIICPIHGVFEQDPSNHRKGSECGRCVGKRKLTTDEVIEDFKKTHGDKYDYSLVNYINSKIKVKIICKEHGEFEQEANSHKNGTGCPKCAGTSQPTTEEAIQKFKQIHGDKYDYSLVEYVKNSIPVKIICSEHGVFEQTPASHLTGSKCPKCSGVHQYTTSEIIEEFKKIHGDKFDYSLVEYIDSKTPIAIICPKHGEFKQTPTNHRNSLTGCAKCGLENSTNAKYHSKQQVLRDFHNTHKDKYDYSKVEYVNSTTSVIIICPEHGEFKQTPNAHKQGAGCIKCAGIYKPTKEELIEEFIKTHGTKYDYSLVEYVNYDTPVKIKCPEHGVFEQIAYNHKNGAECPVCSGRGWMKNQKLYLLDTLNLSDLLTMDPFEIYTIIGQGKLPIDFGTLANTGAGSDERITTLQELKERFSNDETEDELSSNETEVVENNDNEIIQIDDVDTEITSNTQSEPRLPHMNLLGDLHSLDNNLYVSMDKEAFESLVQYKLRKLWNSVLNNDVAIETLENETGGEYFNEIKKLFFEEYEQVASYKPKEGYSFKHQPNLMQKLTVLRLIKNKSYGNWSGTGAGKTLSFIVASREIDAKLTVIIALNSTIKQTCKSIKEVYPNSKTYTDYQEGFVFDRTKYNYLVLNYEKFQQEYSEGLFQDLTNNNQIDFVVIDEVHNAKQRQEDDESKRREVMNRLLGRIREKNTELYTLVMSATPVVNNLYEAKSLLQLMTGLDYNDIDTRRTLANALKIFQQLILNGLRFIPKYDIEMSELTGSNMTNLNIDGGYLLETILELPQSNYIAIEKLLLDDKLKAVTPYLRKGVILYSYFTTGFINEIESYIKQQGFKVGTYTGEESPYIREENLSKFISGDLDILIGSRPIGTGVDGLQGVSDRMILLTLPWTDSEYTQLKGRIYRQGSLFGSVEIIIPQVRINLEDGDFWSWDVQRLNVIKNKKTLADAAVDGIVPSRVLPRPETMFKKSQESLQRWKDRVNGGNLIELTRNTIQIDLYPEIVDDEQRQARIQSELSEFNRRGKTTKSSTMHKEFTDNPDSWFRYHALRKERMGQWDEVPYEYIATKIRNRNHKVIDFGCGENLFKDCIPNNEVISFDHISHNGSIACDMKDISKWVENESVDVCVFSLSLWGTNYKDYIAESYRVLNYGGVIHIAEPAKDYNTPELEMELKTLIEDVGFKVVGDIERRSKFIYITGIKM